MSRSRKWRFWFSSLSSHEWKECDNLCQEPNFRKNCDFISGCSSRTGSGERNNQQVSLRLHRNKNRCNNLLVFISFVLRMRTWLHVCSAAVFPCIGSHSDTSPHLNSQVTCPFDALVCSPSARSKQQDAFWKIIPARVDANFLRRSWWAPELWCGPVTQCCTDKISMGPSGMVRGKSRLARVRWCWLAFWSVLLYFSKLPSLSTPETYYALETVCLLYLPICQARLTYLETTCLPLVPTSFLLCIFLTWCDVCRNEARYEGDPQSPVRPFVISKPVSKIEQK